ncbi:MAG: 30S ribosomal protein S13 [Nitrospirae bacterium]|nr:30S ribosomal protein S13 [Nitrospirota bacterium]
MARIAGVDLPKKERVEIGLTRIFGIGRSLSKKILAEAEVNPNIRVNDLSNEDVAKIRGIIDKEQKVEGDLRKEISMSIKRLTDIGCYRGLRHKTGLPVRGQRTKTNARTRRGPAKGVVKKKEAVVKKKGGK